MDRSFSLRPFAAVLCAGFALSLAGCGQSQPERSFANDPNAAVTGQFVAGQTLSAPITAKDVKDETASFAVLTLPPQAVRNGRVTEKQYINGWRQSMALDNAKEGGDWNDLSVDILGVPGTGARGEIMIGKPTQEGIRREILARFQNTPMRIVNRPMQNALGPYGLAIGAGAGGLRCAFAWQWVDSLPAVARGEKPGLFGANGEMAGSIRMRLCRRGVTVDELAQYYEQLGVSQPNLDRIADAIRRNLAANIGPDPGGATTPVTPGAAVGGGRVTASVDSLESSLLGSEPEAYEPRPAAPTRRAPRRASKRAASAPAPAAAEPEAAPAPAPIPAAPADGRRYLGPVSDAGGSSYAQNAPAAGGGGAGFGTAINGLPAQALRGPSGARAITPYLGAQ